MNENKEYVYMIDDGRMEKCEIVRRTETYIFIRCGESEYKIHKHNENSDYFLYKYGKWRFVYFYKHTEEIERRYKKHIIVARLKKIGYDVYQNSVLGDGLVFHMVQRMKEFISQVESNRDLFQEKDAGQVEP
jgi:hypothetical protein